MKEVKFEQVKKDFPPRAEEILEEQETLVLFLNSPVRKNWMAILKLKKAEQAIVGNVVGHYAQLKIGEENRLKPKSKADVIRIENNVLRKLFEQRLIKIKNVKDKKEAAKVAKAFVKKEFPKAVIFDAIHLGKLATLAGVESKALQPTDLVVFDKESTKIISFEAVSQ